MSMTRAARQRSAPSLMPAPVTTLGRLGSWSYRHRRLVTVAWVIVLIVISLGGRLAGSAFGDLRVLRVIGLGMAVAVLLDATLLRMVATPAVLQLTGRANWWFPRWLDRIMPSSLTEVGSTEKGTS